MNEMLLPKISLYAAERQLLLTRTLGSGKDGIVGAAKGNNHPSNLAIKIFRHSEAYLREKLVYQRLEESKIETILGFNVPKMIYWHDEFMAIEMTIVERPFVLDFAGAYLDARPEFPEEIWADWESEKREQFEGRWPMVQTIIAAFQNLGIHLLDVSPSNIGFLDDGGS